MAILHRATLVPTKLELVEAWLDRQPWGGAGPLVQIGCYRFDDPEGEVGVEAILVRRGDVTLQAAMTYRGAPLAGAEQHLIGTMQHSVLGPRWVYDAAADPVAIGCFTRTLDGEQQQAALDIYEGDHLVGHRDPDVRLHAESGPAAPGELRIVHVLDVVPTARANLARHLVASWSGGSAVVAFG